VSFPNRNAWTDARDAELCKLYDAGLPLTAIARAMKLTKNQVGGRLMRLGLRRRGSPIRPSSAPPPPRAPRPPALAELVPLRALEGA
jgi:hypothetical protein